jgi:hypothetical protein
VKDSGRHKRGVELTINFQNSVHAVEVYTNAAGFVLFLWRTRIRTPLSDKNVMYNAETYTAEMSLQTSRTRVGNDGHAIFRGYFHDLHNVFCGLRVDDNAVGCYLMQKNQMPLLQMRERSSPGR